MIAFSERLPRLLWQQVFERLPDIGWKALSATCRALHSVDEHATRAARLQRSRARFTELSRLPLAANLVIVGHVQGCRELRRCLIARQLAELSATPLLMRRYAGPWAALRTVSNASAHNLAALLEHDWAFVPSESTARATSELLEFSAGAEQRSILLTNALREQAALARASQFFIATRQSPHQDPYELEHALRSQHGIPWPLPASLGVEFLVCTRLADHWSYALLRPQPEE